VYKSQAGRGRVGLDALMAALAGLGVNEVHTECGPTLAGALLESSLVDEVVVYLAPMLLGDAARGMFTLPAIVSMRERIGLDISGVTQIGADLRASTRLRRPVRSRGEAAKQARIRAPDSWEGARAETIRSEDRTRLHRTHGVPREVRRGPRANGTSGRDTMFTRAGGTPVGPG